MIESILGALVWFIGFIITLVGAIIYCIPLALACFYVYKSTDGFGSW